MRRNMGASSPFILCAVLSMAVARPLVLTSQLPVPYLLKCVAVTASTYLLACLVSDPEDVLVEMWSKHSVVPAILGCVATSITACFMWHSAQTVLVVTICCIAYLALITCTVFTTKWAIGRLLSGQTR